MEITGMEAKTKAEKENHMQKQKDPNEHEDKYLKQEEKKPHLFFLLYKKRFILLEGSQRKH